MKFLVYFCLFFPCIASIPSKLFFPIKLVRCIPQHIYFKLSYGAYLFFQGPRIIKKQFLERRSNYVFILKLLKKPSKGHQTSIANIDTYPGPTSQPTPLGVNDVVFQMPVIHVKLFNLIAFFFLLWVGNIFLFLWIGIYFWKIIYGIATKSCFTS